MSYRSSFLFISFLIHQLAGGASASSRAMRRWVAIASRSACSFVRPRVTVRWASPVAPVLVVLLVLPLRDSAASAWEGACASTLAGTRPATGGSTFAPGGIDSWTVAGETDEASVDGTSVLRDIDSPAVAGDSDEPADDGSGPAVGSRSPVGDWVGASAVCAGAAGALDSDALEGGPPVMGRGSGGRVGSTDIQ